MSRPAQPPSPCLSEHNPACHPHLGLAAPTHTQALVTMTLLIQGRCDLVLLCVCVSVCVCVFISVCVCVCVCVCAEGHAAAMVGYKVYHQVPVPWSQHTVQALSLCIVVWVINMQKNLFLNHRPFVSQVIVKGGGDRQDAT